jgi:iron complex transport system substrate-binding protein
MKQFRFIFLLFTIFSIVNSCKNESEIDSIAIKNGKKLELKYAEGFSITKYKTHSVLIINSPWPNSKETFKYILAQKNISGQSEVFNAFINTPIKNIVVTSTTHISSLELLGVETSLVGFPGLDYISSENTRQRIKNKKIRELGKNEVINTEVLLELNPDAVIGFGVDGVNKSFETLKKAGIPILYNGDWVESSPLAKAEWIKFFGALFNKEIEADSIFNQIESDYLNAKQLAKQVKSQPTVLSGAMHKDVWYLPNGSSPEAQFLKDANVNYLWQDTTTKGSLALSFETVFNKARNANIWLSPSYYSSLEALEKANQHYIEFEAFQNKSIYSFSNTIGETGGVLYYELGTARPDLVLKDIIKVCHPEVLPDYEPYFFKPLE